MAQEAQLRSRIAAYFEQAQEAAAAAPADAAAPSANGGEAVAAADGADAAVPAAGEAVSDALPPAAAAAADGGENPVGGLAGLPVRGGHSSLALDCRELLAWARRSGLVSGRLW